MSNYSVIIRRFYENYSSIDFDPDDMLIAANALDKVLPDVTMTHRESLAIVSLIDIARQLAKAKDSRG